ncbi:MAG: C69 family dipeptidase [Bradymonadaceae bacterium]
MCDSFVVTSAVSGDGSVWFGKNSDREPGEAQALDHIPSRRHAPGARLRTTHVEIPQAQRTHEILISRPVWMWGAEMGANEKGLVVGNQAVFTREPVPRTGLTGMDLVRLALERADTAEEALELITDLIARHGQGGRCGYRNHGFRYHSAFILADRLGAWVLETAGSFWAAKRVQGIRTLSNTLSIGSDFDKISNGAYRHARRQGWCEGPGDFDFARCFTDPLYRSLSGGLLRSRCTFNRLYSARHIGLESCMSVLRDHGGEHPAHGWRMKTPCAHASWWPTRHAGQTTASMINRLSPAGDVHWLTGTSSPCLSVFKPVILGGDILDAGPTPSQSNDDKSLFWRHEALHRMVLEDYDALRPIFEEERLRLEEQALGTVGGDWQIAWDEHRQALQSWLRNVKGASPKRRTLFPKTSLFNAYWRLQSRRDDLSS